MTRPKKGTRPITVGGTEYRWRVRAYHHSEDPYKRTTLHTLLIHLAGKNPGRSLKFSFPMGEIPITVSPRHVEAIIKAARLDGWNEPLVFDAKPLVFEKARDILFPPEPAKPLDPSIYEDAE